MVSVNLKIEVFQAATGHFGKRASATHAVFSSKRIIDILGIFLRL